MSKPEISFEFFPPKTLEASFRLWDTVQTLAPLDPRFVSVTYGAGGTTRELTRDAVSTLHKSSGLNVAAHLTCVDASRQETLEIADTFARAGVQDIVALRGDPPKGQDKFVPHPDGFSSSVELIEALAETEMFSIRVGAYPDTHPEAANMAADVDWLKAKLDAGADEALTQFFFEAETFFGSAMLAPRPVSTNRSCLASCRSRTGQVLATSPSAVARIFPCGSNRRLKRRCAMGVRICWPRQSAQSCVQT